MQTESSKKLFSHDKPTGSPRRKDILNALVQLKIADAKIAPFNKVPVLEKQWS